jgi:serine/threonine protein kinase
MSTEAVTCPRCSVRMPDGARYCPHCGGTLEDDESLPADLLSTLRRDLSGQYQISDLLGRGGMSFVFLAQELELDRQVAMKVLPLQLLPSPGSAERFQREGRIAASLDHPHIVPVFRVGATSTCLWFTMKRIRGRSLEQLIGASGGLPLTDVLSVVRQVGSALHYAHRQGVVHRDVKPGNVMIEDSGWALVCDFGVARALGSASLTQSGASLGTPRYMAPEQFEGRAIDGRCDQYSLGILVWEALTGTVPFDGDTVAELIRQHLLEPPPRLSAARPDLPARVSDAVFRAMSKNPAERFPDIAAFVSALSGEATPRLPDASSTPLPRVLTFTPPENTIRLAALLRPRWAVTLPLLAALGLAGAVWSLVLNSNGRASSAMSAGGTTAYDAARPVKSQVAETAATQPTPALPPPLPPPPPPSERPPSRSAARQPRQVVPAPASAWFSLSTQPPGMFILDGKAIRSTPVLRLAITPGRHRAQVRRDGFAPLDTVFDARPGEEIKWTRRVLRPL